MNLITKILTFTILPLIIIVAIFQFLPYRSYELKKFSCESDEITNHDNYLKEFHNGETKKVYLVVHGLNNPPEMMETIISSLNDSTIFNTSFGGHYEKNAFEAMKSVNHNSWRKDLFYSYCIASRYAKERDVPLYFLAYSTGATVFNSLIVDHPEISKNLKGQILYAPAINIYLPMFVRNIFNLLPDSFSINSQNFPEFRKNDATTMAAYNALFTLVHHISIKGLTKTIPSLVTVDKSDELIDHRNLNVAARGLDNWTFDIFSNNFLGDYSWKYHHFIIAPKVIGDDEWKRINSLRNKFIGIN